MVGLGQRTVGGLAWTLVVLAILVEIPVAGAWHSPPYDPLELTVSDLGATTCTTLGYPTGPVPVCSPLHRWMNAMTVFGGLCLGVGGVALRWLVRRGPRRVFFVALMLITAASWMAAAWVPVDHNLQVHALVALPAFIGIGVALLLVNGAPGHLQAWRGVAFWVGLFALLATVATVAAQALGLPLGLVERIALYPPLVWCIGLGLGVLRGARGAESR